LSFEVVVVAVAVAGVRNWRVVVLVVFPTHLFSGEVPEQMLAS
jgi:hypothetical protein